MVAPVLEFNYDVGIGHRTLSLILTCWIDILPVRLHRLNTRRGSC